MTTALNVLISASVIAFAAWLSGRHPTLAGFLIAMPIATLLVLPMAYAQHGDAENTVLMAKSIFLAVPVSLLFFVPFFFSERWGLSFWQTYLAACALLPVGFVAHRFALRFFGA